MKIDYKILWLDDNIQEFVDDELIESLEDFLEESGFRPIINYTASIKDFFSRLNDSYDLIMTDYHMKDMNGDKVVEKIRSSEYSILTEILFYTAQADLKGTNKISRVSFLETNTKTGTHQEALIEETKKLIALTIKKFQNIVAMRGMIMHETSSLDVEMESILRNLIQSSKAPDEIISVIKSKYLETNDKFNKEVGETSEIEAILFKIGASHRWRAVLRNIPKGALKLILQDYEREVINIRNKFAHAILEKDPNTGREYFKHGESGLTFDEELCKKIRKDINKHKTNFDNLQNELK